MNLLLECEIFQSYSSIVVTNENLEDSLISSRKKRLIKTPTQQQEGIYHFHLKKRYMKLFLRIYNSHKSSWISTANLVDSDFDEYDEYEREQIEEMFQDDGRNGDEIDSDDENEPESMQMIQEKNMNEKLNSSLNNFIMRQASGQVCNDC